MSQLQDDLKAIHALLSNGWCQQASATDLKGSAVGVFADSACCFCLTGAIRAVCCSTHTSGDGYASGFSRSESARNALGETFISGTLVVFNDTHTKQEVLDLVQRAQRAAA